MKCPNCEKENDARALFCDGCGEIFSRRAVESFNLRDRLGESPRNPQGLNVWGEIVLAFGGYAGLVMMAVIAFVLFALLVTLTTAGKSN